MSSSSPNAKPKKLFVVGMHRSGTSILADLLKAHPSISGHEIAEMPPEQQRIPLLLVKIQEAEGLQARLKGEPEPPLKGVSVRSTPEGQSRIAELLSSIEAETAKSPKAKAARIEDLLMKINDAEATNAKLKGASGFTFLTRWNRWADDCRIGIVRCDSSVAKFASEEKLVGLSFPTMSVPRASSYRPFSCISSSDS